MPSARVLITLVFIFSQAIYLLFYCLDFNSFMTFIGNDYSLAEARKQCFFIQFQSAILKIADYLSLFDSDDDVLSLKACVQESWLPLPSATQLAESMVKNANFCKSTGKDEANTSNLAMIRSVNITSVNSAIKESDQFRNRKRRNEELPDYLHNQMCNVKTLTETHSRKREGAHISNNEFNHCRKLMTKENNCCKRRQSETAHKCLETKDKTKRDNAAMQITDVNYAPMMEGNAQIGNAHNNQRKLLIEELCLRGITVDPKEIITEINKKVD